MNICEYAKKERKRSSGGFAPAATVIPNSPASAGRNQRLQDVPLCATVQRLTRPPPEPSIAGPVGKGGASEQTQFFAPRETSTADFATPLSRFACSRRAASLRLGLVCGPPCGPALALASVHPRCSLRLSASSLSRFLPSATRSEGNCSAACCSGLRPCAVRRLRKPFCRCSRALSASFRTRPGRDSR